MTNLEAESRARVDSLTLPRLIQRNAEQYGDDPALTVGDVTTTWRALRDDAAAIARGLAAIGLARGERMMIMMSSRLEHWQVDLGAAHLGAVPCTVYRTSSAEQIAYMARHSGATVAVLEDAADVAIWSSVASSLPRLHRIIVLDRAAIPPGDIRFVAWADLMESGRALHGAEPRVFETYWAPITPDDPIALMYTSGTTGDPKGVVLSHRNVFYEAASVDLLVPVPMQSRSVAYLPLAHIAERELGIYRAAYKALHVTVCTDLATLVHTLIATRPPAFFGVPRIWEKFADGLRACVASATPEKQATIHEAHALALEAYRREGRGEAVPDDLKRRVASVETTVLRPLRAMIGLDALTWASSGAAPIPVDVLEYLGGFNIKVLEVWGMSETTGCATINTPAQFRVGAVGRPLPGVDVKIADDGEIFVRGPIVFLGYLDADGNVANATDADGWLATGDVGPVDADGFLRVTDRKKELIINSMGKNIAPSPIEGLLRAHPLIGHAIVVGDRRPYLTALLALEHDAARAWAKAKQLTVNSLTELMEHPLVRAELDTLVATVNARLSRPEQVKRYRIVPDAWLPGTTMITPTMKLRRRAVLDRYGDQISAMYDEG